MGETGSPCVTTLYLPFPVCLAYSMASSAGQPWSAHLACAGGLLASGQCDGQLAPTIKLKSSISPKTTASRMKWACTLCVSTRDWRSMGCNLPTTSQNVSIP